MVKKGLGKCENFPGEQKCRGVATVSNLRGSHDKALSMWAGFSYLLHILLTTTTPPSSPSFSSCPPFAIISAITYCSALDIRGMVPSSQHALNTCSCHLISQRGKLFFMYCTELNWWLSPFCSLGLWSLEQTAHWRQSRRLGDFHTTTTCSSIALETQHMGLLPCRHVYSSIHPVIIY